MEIETKRLLLRPIRDDDAPAIARSLNNYEVAKYMSRVAHPYSQALAIKFIQFQRGLAAHSKLCAIAFKCAPDELLGIVSYEFSEENQKTEFGYWINESCWRQGIMSEAAKALVDYAFTTGGVSALNAGYWNPISGQLLKKIGFRETHRKMSFCLAENKEVPSIQMRLTREQWMEAK